MSNDEAPQSSMILYQTEDGRTRIQCRFEDETIWLTQALIAELFQTSIPNINLHLKAIYAERELTEAATIKSYLIVRTEGSRQVSREVLHYSLPAILAVDYRVRSHRGTQFRQWATARLSEYLVKGFTMDDERLKNPPGKGHTDYFDELLERIRDLFDFIVIDECHRGGANDESTLRDILDYFAPAVQLGLTATPKRKDNVDTYAVHRIAEVPG